MSCSSSGTPPVICTEEPPEARIYRAFIFSILMLFTLALLLLFYLFYLRHRRSDWASLQIRIPHRVEQETTRLSNSGIKKEVREMFPIVVFHESFTIKELICSVCLGDYKPDDRLKRIPGCGHTFHVDCIDLWLTTNVTCPLCRSSLIPTPRASLDPSELQGPQLDLESQINGLEFVAENGLRTGDEAGNSAIVNDCDSITIGRSCIGDEDSVCRLKDVDCGRNDGNQDVV